MRNGHRLTAAIVVAAVTGSFSTPLRTDAGTGIFDSYVVVNSGGGNTFYEFGFNFSPVQWPGTNLGSFNPTGSTSAGQLTLNGGEIKTFKNGGGDVTGAEINYRIYLTGNSPPSFSATGLPFNADLGNGDQRWQATGANINVLLANPTTARAPGAYTFEVFGKAFTNEGDRFVNNGGANYSATFTVNIADFLWDGGGTDGNVSTANNWSNNIAPAVGHNLAFAGSTNTSVINTLATVNKITFNSGASPFTFGGGALTVNGGGIVNASGNVQTVNANVTLGANQSFDTGSVANGALAIGGTVNTSGKALTVTGSNNGTFSNVVSGTGSLTKQGSGRLTMATGVTQTYSGTTTVSQGSLFVNGTHNGGDNYTVASGATLGGSGSVVPASAKNVAISGNVSPGNSVGKLTLTTSGGNGTTTGITDLAQGGSYTWEINAQTPATPGTSWDLLALGGVSVTATTTSGQQFTIKIVSLNGSTPGPTPGWIPGDPGSPKTFTIATSSTNSFLGVNLAKFAIDTSQFQDAYPTGWSLAIGNSGGSLDLVYVPEPGSVAMIIGSSAAVLRRRRRVGA